MADVEKYLYGPVPSRRLGLSLGVDVMPFKVCTLDCIYCQLGRSSHKTTERREYVSVEPILAELKNRLAKGLDADFITLGGSGEPTLNSGIGRLIDGIRETTDIPVAILTNGTLLYQEPVRADCAKADVVLPSLDACDEETFVKINRPHESISVGRLIDGLCAFRAGYAGQIWLEVFLVPGVNTDIGQIAGIKRLVERIRPDKIHLNTAVRPAAEPGVKRLDEEGLRDIAARLGPTCEVIADFSPPRRIEALGKGAADVFSMLRRRPCSLEDVSSGLGIGRQEAAEYIGLLRRRGLVTSEKKNGATFFRAG